MTKIEEKLIELGYRRSHYDYNNVTFIKIYKNKYNLFVETNGYITCVIMNYVDLDGMAIYNQQDIDNLQQAFNQLQKDLEILKEVEEDVNK